MPGRFCRSVVFGVVVVFPVGFGGSSGGAHPETLSWYGVLGKLLVFFLPPQPRQKYQRAVYASSILLSTPVVALCPCTLASLGFLSFSASPT